MFSLDILGVIARAIGRAGRHALIAAAVFAGAGSAMADPAADSQQFDTIYQFQLKPALQKFPALERIMRERPEIAADMRAKMRAAYDKGGPSLLLEESPAIGATVLAGAFTSYMPRARGADLIAFARTMGDVLGAFQDKDPEACILYQFGTTYGRPLGRERMMAAIGIDRQKVLLDVMNLIVVNAADKPIAFDDAKATEALETLAVKRLPLLTGKSGEVAEGQRPAADAAEAKAACSFGVALFNDIAGMDAPTAELILRKMLAGGA